MSIEDLKKHGHPGNQFNRKFSVGEEGFTFSTSITWEERAILTNHLRVEGIEPNKATIAGLAKKLMKDRLNDLAKKF